MPVIYWDASALIKRYIPEAGSDAVFALIENALGFRLCATTLGYAEAFSILQRKFRDKRIDKGTMDAAVSSLDKSCLYASDIELLSVNDAAIMGGVRLMARHTINSSDATILIVFLEHKMSLSPGTVCRLICSDKHLIRAANLEGLVSVNPELMSVADIEAMIENCRSLEA